MSQFPERWKVPVEDGLVLTEKLKEMPELEGASKKNKGTALHKDGAKR